MSRFILMLVILMLGLTACAEDAKEADPTDPVEAYFEALVKGDGDTMRKVSCAEWEAQAVNQATSFEGVAATLEGMQCEKSGTDGEDTLVKCEGKIATSYDGEARDFPLGE